MNDQPPIQPAPLAWDPFYGALVTNWRWMLALGILSLVLGIVGLGLVAFLSLAGVLLFGVLMALGGGVQIAQAFQCSGWKGALLHAAIAVLYLAVGVLVVIMPVDAVVTLTLILGVALLVSGGLRTVMAFQHRGMPGWGWLLAAAIASLILGGIIIGGWPGNSFWVIGLIIAVELIVNGWSYIFLALAARQGSKAMVDQDLEGRGEYAGRQV